MSAPPGSRPLVANARMYSVEPRSAAAWRTLFDRVAGIARVPMTYVELEPGEPLERLWQRDDLGCALMCGYPWATWRAWSPPSGGMPQPRALAAPVPDVDASGGRSMYRTSIVVRDDAPFGSLSDLRGRRFAFTTPTSQSGYQAVRAHLVDPGRDMAEPYFGAMVGPLVTPRRVVEAVLAGAADAGPVDSYWLAILERHEPATARRLRTVESTAWTPMPLFVCAASVPVDTASAITRALLAAGRDAELADVRAALVLAGIANVEPASYAALVDRAGHADAVGYPVLQ